MNNDYLSEILITAAIDGQSSPSDPLAVKLTEDLLQGLAQQARSMVDQNNGFLLEGVREDGTPWAILADIES